MGEKDLASLNQQICRLYHSLEKNEQYPTSHPSSNHPVTVYSCFSPSSGRITYKADKIFPTFGMNYIPFIDDDNNNNKRSCQACVYILTVGWIGFKRKRKSKFSWTCKYFLAVGTYHPCFQNIYEQLNRDLNVEMTRCNESKRF